MKAKAFLLLVMFLALAFPASALADGIIIPEPPPCDDCLPIPGCPYAGPCPVPSPMVQLAIRYHHVDVTIEDQVAVTHVDQVFFNPNDWAVEGTYVFPLPVDAAVTSFTLWVDGEPVEGQILDAEQARQTYRQIVSSLRDPALLEYAGRGAVQAHIFPIPPQGERRIELEYSQALASENGLVRYVYPLGTEKFSAQPLESVAVNVDITSDRPIRAAYSPSHSVAISREGPDHVLAGYEAEDVLPDSDFALVYSIGENEAFHLMSYRNPFEDDPDGFFLLLLAPSPEVSPQAIPKDVLLVIDRSGSMEGEKFRQAQDALRYVLNHLNPEDRFNLISFSTGLESFAGRMQPAEQAPQALEWVDRQSAQGSTDINRALLEAASLADRERPTYLIFLTDGLPTEGEVVSQKILQNFRSAASGNLRLFPFGVGYDVDTFLLDSLAQENHGASTYVLPGEPLDEILSAFYARISTPVLTDLELDFQGIPVYDLYPEPLPDLFEGSQIILVGRYREGGLGDVELSGMVNGEKQAFSYPQQSFASNSTSEELATSGPQSAIPRLWATRKIGYLLNQIRLKGPNQETIDQVVRLSIRYGIVTPYTSYLVTEPMLLGAAEQERIIQQQVLAMEAAPTEAAFGQTAVQKAADQASLAAAEAPAEQSAEAAGRVRQVGARAFVLSSSRWVDTAFDPATMETIKAAFLSDDYFALAERYPELAEAFALGPAVIAFAEGSAYEVVAQGSQVAPLDIPAAPLQATGTTQPAQLPEQTPETLTQPAEEQSPAATNAAEVTPTDSEQRNPLLCGGGLLPILLIPIGLVGLQIWKRRRLP